jgi:hypothetical protein
MSRAPSLPTVAFGWYYFTRTAADKRRIITNESERHAFSHLLNATLGRHGVHLYFVHVDENEMHLGMRAGGGSLTKTLGSFCEKFAHEVNRARSEKGPLFRPHAHVLLIQRGRWFVLLGRFIHWIPRLRGQISEGGDSQLSSDAYYRRRKRVRGLETSVILRMVSNGSRKPEVQHEAYRALFDQPPSAAEIYLFRKGSPQDSRMVGDPTFIVRTTRELGVVPSPRADGQLAAQDEIPCAIARMLESFRVACEERLPATTAQKWMRVSTLENVCSRSRQPPLPMLRALAASHLIHGGRFRLSQLERCFHCRPGTLSAGRRRAYEAKFEAMFRQRYQEVILDDHDGFAQLEAPRKGMVMNFAGSTGTQGLPEMEGV